MTGVLAHDVLPAHGRGCLAGGSCVGGGRSFPAATPRKRGVASFKGARAPVDWALRARMATSARTPMPAPGRTGTWMQKVITSVTPPRSDFGNQWKLKSASE